MRNNPQNEATSYVGDFPLDDTLYRIGPGDVFQIFTEGMTSDKPVDPEGNLILNRIGVLHLNGLTLKDAEKLILQKLRTSFKPSECFVSLARPKIMRVFITGAVQEPGSYKVPGNMRLTNLIEAAESFASMAQMGYIYITAADGTIDSVDIGKFYMQGDLNSNPYLTQGCVVEVPYVDYSKPWVTIRCDTSSVPTQLEPDENIRHLLMRNYVYRNPPPYTAVIVTHEDGKQTIVPPQAADTYKPAAGDVLDVILHQQKVFIAGAVEKPGYELYYSNRKLIDYLGEAGLTSKSSLSSTMDVIHANGEGESVSLRDGTLKPGDVVYVNESLQQKFLIYTPVLLSAVSLTLALISVLRL